MSFAACGGSVTCRLRSSRAPGDVSRSVGPRSGASACRRAGADAAAPTRPSRLIAHVDLKLATLAKELEVRSRRVSPRRETRGSASPDISTTRSTADPSAVAIEGDSLVVRTDVKVAPRPVGPESCYASCEPQGRATATVPSPDAGLSLCAIARHFCVHQGCEVRALGIVKVDVTPIIQN